MTGRRNPTNSATSAQEGSEQFDSSTYLKQEDYNADIEAIEKRLDKIEERTKDSGAIINTIKDVFEKDRNIDPVIGDYFKKHPDIMKPYIEAAVVSIDKRNLKFFMKGAGKWALGLVYSLILIAATAYITVTITNANTPKQSSTSENKSR